MQTWRRWGSRVCGCLGEEHSRRHFSCSRTEGRWGDWSRESQGRAVRGEEKAGLAGLGHNKDFLVFTLKEMPSCQRILERVPWAGLCFNRLISAAVLTSRDQLGCSCTKPGERWCESGQPWRGRWDVLAEILDILWRKSCLDLLMN